MQSLAHTRLVRRRISKSTRPPPLAQLSISTFGCRARQLVEQPIQRQRLGVRAGRAVATAGVHVVAIHVPLDEGHVVVAQQRVQLITDVCVGLGDGQVEQQLIAGQDRLVVGVDKCPLGVGAVEIAVGVDHLRLDPDAELHAQRP